MLGSESGSNAFDYDGYLEQQINAVRVKSSCEDVEHILKLCPSKLSCLPGKVAGGIPRFEVAHWMENQIISLYRNGPLSTRSIP